MSLLALSRTRSCWRVVRAYSTSGAPSAQKPIPSESGKTVSSCPAGTVLTGLNYLKNEPPILAKPDDEYPPWLWDLVKPKTIVDDGTGGKAEKRRLRLQHRQALKDSNLFKAK